MKISRFETFLANCGLRNYLFIRLTTDTGLTGVGEATLEWQEKTVQTLCHEWLDARVLGRDPFDIERVVGDLIRDQYQGGSTVMTAISGVEVALWDIVGKACGQPRLQPAGRPLPRFAAGLCQRLVRRRTTPDDFARRAREVVERGYRAMKFDPLGTAWQELPPAETELAVESVAKVREAVGPAIELMIEFHGRLSGRRGDRAHASARAVSAGLVRRACQPRNASNCWPK